MPDLSPSAHHNCLRASEALACSPACSMLVLPATILRLRTFLHEGRDGLDCDECLRGLGSVLEALHFAAALDGITRDMGAMDRGERPMTCAMPGGLFAESANFLAIVGWCY